MLIKMAGYRHFPHVKGFKASLNVSVSDFCPGLENLVSHILVKIEFDQFLDLLGFALSLHAVTVQKYQQLSNILVWKNLVSHIHFFLDDPCLEKPSNLQSQSD